jgi:hypothetical protein
MARNPNAHITSWIAIARVIPGPGHSPAPGFGQPHQCDFELGFKIQDWTFIRRRHHRRHRRRPSHRHHRHHPEAAADSSEEVVVETVAAAVK